MNRLRKENHSSLIFNRSFLIGLPLIVTLGFFTAYSIYKTADSPSSNTLLDQRTGVENQSTLRESGSNFYQALAESLPQVTEVNTNNDQGQNSVTEPAGSPLNYNPISSRETDLATSPDTSKSENGDLGPSNASSNKKQIDKKPRLAD
jgi:hypothetical protein